MLVNWLNNTMNININNLNSTQFYNYLKIFTLPYNETDNNNNVSSSDIDENGIKKYFIIIILNQVIFVVHVFKMMIL